MNWSWRWRRAWSRTRIVWKIRLSQVLWRKHVQEFYIIIAMLTVYEMIVDIAMLKKSLFRWKVRSLSSGGVVLLFCIDSDAAGFRYLSLFHSKVWMIYLNVLHYKSWGSRWVVLQFPANTRFFLAPRYVCRMLRAHITEGRDLKHGTNTINPSSAVTALIVKKF
jgi:hypothetical protein